MRKYYYFKRPKLQVIITTTLLIITMTIIYKIFFFSYSNLFIEYGIFLIILGFLISVLKNEKIIFGKVIIGYGLLMMILSCFIKNM